MVPERFDAGSLPLDQMWDDEAYWLPRVLSGETLAGPAGAGTVSYGLNIQEYPYLAA